MNWKKVDAFNSVGMNSNLYYIIIMYIESNETIKQEFIWICMRVVFSMHISRIGEFSVGWETVRVVYSPNLNLPINKTQNSFFLQIIVFILICIYLIVALFLSFCIIVCISLHSNSLTQPTVHQQLHILIISFMSYIRTLVLTSKEKLIN